MIEAVHAVQRPLIAPDISSLSILDRAAGPDTSARPLIHAACSIDSTDRLDLLAEWHEPIDDPASTISKTGPADRQRRDTAFQVKDHRTQRLRRRHQGGVAPAAFREHTHRREPDRRQPRSR